jgi:subtilisin family serine protease
MAQLTSIDPESAQPGRVVVCFRPGVDLPRGRPTNAQVEQRMPFWKEMTERFPNVSIDPVLTEEAVESLDKLSRDAIARSGGAFKPADFRAYYYVDGVAEEDFEPMLAFLRAQKGDVERAYIDAPAPLPAGGGGAPVSQAFLGPARQGIDAHHAWTLPGGRGEQQLIVDFEQGWTKEHQDLAGQNINLALGAITDSERNHGTSVLGILCAANHAGQGYHGVVPGVAEVKLVAYSSIAERPSSLATAATLMSFGDVLLIEAQISLEELTDKPRGPIEALGLDYDIIRTLTATGIVVIEAGGNGTRLGRPVNLDRPVDRTGIAFLRRDGGNPDLNPDYRESGALLVSAARADEKHERMPFAPFGKRIDCFAWGESIQTLASDAHGAITGYTTFGGTSGASAIIAGAAVAVQGFRQAHGLPRLDSLQMRATLSNLATGTDSKSAQKIGVMPDLKKILVPFIT